MWNSVCQEPETMMMLVVDGSMVDVEMLVRMWDGVGD